MNKQTLSLKFLQLLADGLPYVDACTPTIINEGGCGIFAYDLACELDKLGINYQVICLFKDNSDPGMKAIQNYIDSGVESSQMGVNHVCLLVENKFYVDSTGIINGVALSYPHTIIVTKDQLKVFIDKGENWSSVFDKRTEPLIKSKLNKVFNEQLDKFDNQTLKIPNSVRLTKYTIEHEKEQENCSFLSQLIGF